MITTIDELLSNTNPKKHGKRIELKGLITAKGIDYDAECGPNLYENIVLLSKGYCVDDDMNDLDLMLAWGNSSDESDRFAFLGHWNDGVK